MPSSPQRPEKPSSSLAQPFLYALNRMREREAVHPQDLEVRAQALLVERFGLSDQPIHARFVPGCAGLMSEHTHFFDGFAVMMPLPFGVAVAVRRAKGAASRLIVEGQDEVHISGSGVQEVPGGDTAVLAAGLFEDLLRVLVPDGMHVEVAVVSTLAKQHADAFLTAFGVALVQAVEHMFPAPTGDGAVPSLVSDAIARCMGRPFSVAYPLSVWKGRADAFMLVDTGTGEWLPLEAPPQEKVGWGLVYADCPQIQERDFYTRRMEQAREALERLRQRGFGDISSFRGLEHRDLQHALDLLPHTLRPLVRYLVGENRRVQKLVNAIRRKDWQMLGALFLISHASKRNDLEVACPGADLTVEQVEQMLIDGMYGAMLTGLSGSVIVVGQPYMVPIGLDRIQEGISSRFGAAPEVVLL